jgi:hypothetical protein
MHQWYLDRFFFGVLLIDTYRIYPTRTASIQMMKDVEYGWADYKVGPVAWDFG